MKHTRTYLVLVLLVVVFALSACDGGGGNPGGDAGNNAKVNAGEVIQDFADEFAEDVEQFPEGVENHLRQAGDAIEAAGCAGANALAHPITAQMGQEPYCEGK